MHSIEVSIHVHLTHLARQLLVLVGLEHVLVHLEQVSNLNTALNRHLALCQSLANSQLTVKKGSNHLKQRLDVVFRHLAGLDHVVQRFDLRVQIAGTVIFNQSRQGGKFD